MRPCLGAAVALAVHPLVRCGMATVARREGGKKAPATESQAVQQVDETTPQHRGGSHRRTAVMAAARVTVERVRLEEAKGDQKQ
jgi:uncharacterized protein YcbX